MNHQRREALARGRPQPHSAMLPEHPRSQGQDKHLENFGFRHALAYHADNGRDRYTAASDAREVSHLVRVLL
jgi:hypothetical protein